MMTEQQSNAAYRIYRAPGWHSEPTDPLIHETDDEREAAMMAGQRVDLNMPGGSNAHDCYAVDEDGEQVEPIESFRCGECEELVEWGVDGPAAVYRDEVYLDPTACAAEKHMIHWVCQNCAEQMDQGD